MELPTPSFVVRLGFPLLVLGTVATFLAIVHGAGAGLDERPARTRRVTVGTALVVAAVLVVTGGLAARGVLASFEPPPPLMIVIAILAAATVVLATGRYGDRLARGAPLWMLVGLEGFRLPLELIMHRAATDGLMPVVMSYSGFNFDVLTGASALVVAYGLYRGWMPRWAVVTWNVLGIALLATIVAVAIAATPMFAAFGPDSLNLWVTRFPYVWLPAIFVQLALFGHIVIMRALLSSRHDAERTDTSLSSATK